ncbi:MAG: hypothetical protein J6V72_14120 [Kiritimatiellae bacterium]|nr:hypothetical protein [Kiritimatiellia bacterium]
MTIIPLLASIVVATNSVTISVVSPDPGLDCPLEFLVVGPDSDNAYEAMFVAEDSVADIDAAFRKAGLPLGSPISPKECKFWPIGTKVTLEPDLWTLIRDMRNEQKRSPVWTGGTREADGSAAAATNMPLSVFSFYNCAQSLMQFDDSLEQSVVYGRFQPAVKIPKGEKRTIKFSWTPGDTNGGKHVMTPDFPPEMTVADAAKLASALAQLDSPDTKVNGYKEGQFFFRAFVPRESWRDRKERLTQPYEVRFVDGKPKLTVIKEDWSDPDATDPKLNVSEATFESVKDRTDIETCFIYAPRSMKLAEVYAVRSLMPKSVVNWYVFGE